jgi:coenzyme F420-reducing hydrogenase delta subunit
MQKAMDAHEKLLDAVQARITAIKNKGGNITGLERAVQVHERRIEILNKILAKANLTEEQRAKIEAKIAHAENVTAKLKALEEKVQEVKQKAKEENKTNLLNETEEQNETADINETNESE